MALIDREHLICIGRVVQAHGLKGALQVTPITGSPGYYTRLREVILDAGKGLVVLPVEELRISGHGWILRGAGITDRTAAEEQIGAEVLVPEDALKPLEPGEYFQHDLMGCTVETLDGESLGTVVGILETGANDVLEVRGGHGEILVPMLANVIEEVLLTERRIRIDPLPGMLEEDA